MTISFKEFIEYDKLQTVAKPQSVQMESTDQSISNILKKINDFAFSELTPDEINGGDCYNWAAVAKLLIPSSKLKQIRDHAFIQIENKFYDAEHIKGVKNWYDLTANKTEPKYLQISELTEKEFYKYWKINTSHISKLMKKISKS